MAEGEYVIVEQANSGAFGPFGEEVYNFHETRTLWRLATGRYKDCVASIDIFRRKLLIRCRAANLQSRAVNAAAPAITSC